MDRASDNGRRTAGVTIRDVAREAGVSIATVSRALDERRPSRSAAADEVRRVAARLGYRRDVSASNLRRGSTGTVGVVVPRLTDTVMAMLYEELARACHRVSRFALVVTTDDDPEQQGRAVETLLRRGVDGLVLATARLHDPYLAELGRSGIPHVLALRTSPGSLASAGDDHLGGYLAARHLLDLGHRAIGLVSGPDYASTARDRTAGFHAALAEAGLDENPEREVAGSFSMQAGEDACMRLLDSAPGRRPTAVFAMNDNTALGALSAIAALGLHVPDDVSVIGYNDIPVASKITVPLTTLRVPFREIATTAVDMLVAPHEYESDPVVRAAPALIPRASTAPPR